MHHWLQEQDLEQKRQQWEFSTRQGQAPCYPLPFSEVVRLLLPYLSLFRDLCYFWQLALRKKLSWVISWTLATVS